MFYYDLGLFLGTLDVHPSQAALLDSYYEFDSLFSCNYWNPLCDIVPGRRTTR